MIWLSVDNGAQYSFLIFINVCIQKSDAGFGICKFNFDSGGLFVKITYKFNQFRLCSVA